MKTGLTLLLSEVQKLKITNEYVIFSKNNKSIGFCIKKIEGVIHLFPHFLFSEANYKVDKTLLSITIVTEMIL